MFLLFFDNVASERALMKIIAERMDYMWFLGYGLDDEIPNHSVLSKARARWGVDVFETLFIRIVAQCQLAGLIVSPKHLPRDVAQFCSRFQPPFLGTAPVQPDASCLSQFFKHHFSRAQGTIASF